MAQIYAYTAILPRILCTRVNRDGDSDALLEFSETTPARRRLCSLVSIFHAENPTLTDLVSHPLHPSTPSGSTEAPRGNFRWYVFLFLWVMATLVMASHRPSSLLQPQFWAEDGKIWYTQAYQQGMLLPLTHTQDGYYQTFPRLVADVAVEFPFSLAPLVMNCLALLVQGLPVVFLLSPRTARWGSLEVRGAMALVYLCLPNSTEWHANTTNTQWVLALLAIMVVLANAPRGWPARSFDLVILTLCRLTGPFCILLAPVACVMAWYRRERWRTVYATLIVGFAAVQGCAIFLTRHSARMHEPLGASVSLLARLLAVRIFTGALVGTFTLLASLKIPLFVPLTIALAALLLMGAAVWRGPLELKLFVLFSGEVLAAALRSPMVHSDLPQWATQLEVPGSRYYFFPMLAFLACAGYLALKARARWLRVVAIVLLCAAPIGIVRNWRDDPYGRQLTGYDGFQADVRRFEAAPRGTIVSLRIEPARTWVMTLVKR